MFVTSIQKLKYSELETAGEYRRKNSESNPHGRKNFLSSPHLRQFVIVPGCPVTFSTYSAPLSPLAPAESSSRRARSRTFFSKSRYKLFCQNRFSAKKTKKFQSFFKKIIIHHCSSSSSSHRRTISLNFILIIKNRSSIAQ